MMPFQMEVFFCMTWKKRAMIHLDLSNYTPALSSFIANAQAILDIKALFSSEDLLKPRPPVSSILI